MANPLVHAPSPSIDQLREIHLPHPVGFWPLPIGWYVLLGLLIAAVFWVWRHHVNTSVKREAERLLVDYEQEYAKHGDASLIAAKISDVLRRVALMYYPRKQVASLHDGAWIDFLNTTCKKGDFNEIRELLLSLPYQKNTQEPRDLQKLFTQVRTWIKQRGKPCSN